MFEPSYTHVIYRLLEGLILCIIGLLLITSPSLPVMLLGCLVLALGQGRYVWLHHELGHNSVTCSRTLDRLLHVLIIGVTQGMSSTWWIRHHNKHHAMPQRVTHDSDLQTMPLLAFNSKSVHHRETGKSWSIQNQVYVFALIFPIGVASVWRYYLGPLYVIKNRLYLEGMCILVHHALAYYCGFWPGLIAFWLGSTIVAVHISMSHTHLPAANESTHWVEYGLRHTADVDQRPWCDWWMALLNYQIEHHLFPARPAWRGPLIKDRIRALAKKHGLPYHVFTYPEAIWQTVHNVYQVSKEFAI